MCRYIETIKLENGRFFRAEFHRQRVNATFAAIFPQAKPFDPAEVLRQQIFPKTGLFKCRIEYTDRPELIEFVPYQRRQISRLKLVDVFAQPTHFKSSDRKHFNDAFALRGECDEVLMVRNGLITDTSYANLAFWNGKDWFTPAQPALYGTQRAFLLDKGEIMAQDISVSDLPNFSRLRIFNAMIEFGEIDLPISAIAY